MPFQIGHYQRRRVLFDGASGNSSTYTSAVHYVGDYAELSIHLDTVNSRATLQASNDDGFRASINTWSAFTGIVTAGVYDITTGFRWMRALRNSADSLAVVTFQGKSIG